MVGYPVTYMVTPARSTWYYHLYMHIYLFLELVQPGEWVTLLPSTSQDYARFTLYLCSTNGSECSRRSQSEWVG